MTNPNEPPDDGVAPGSSNGIYDHLIRQPNDLVGMVAYACYKRQKREAIKAYEEGHDHLPDTEVVHHFHLTLSTPYAMAAYRERAEALMQNWATRMQVRIEEEVNQRLARSFEARLCSAVDRAQPGFWKTVGYGALSSVVVAVGVMTFAFLAAGSVVRFADAFARRTRAFQQAQSGEGVPPARVPEGQADGPQGP